MDGRWERLDERFLEAGKEYRGDLVVAYRTQANGCGRDGAGTFALQRNTADVVGTQCGFFFFFGYYSWRELDMQVPSCVDVLNLCLNSDEFIPRY